VQVTTKDIARVCGISRGTVDRALNGKPRIDPDTKALILKTAREMGYRPDLLARSLVKGRTMSLGVVVYDIRNRYFAQLVSAIEMEAKRRGYFLNITLQENDPEMESRLIGNLVDRRVDGLILCPVNKGEAFRAFLKSLPAPSVVIGNYIAPDIPFVGIDERAAAIDAVELIVSKGYERIIFVCPPLANASKENIYSHEQRLAGFYEAIGRHSVSSRDVVGSDDYLDRLPSALRESGAKTAFFCSGDIYALNAIRRLRAEGLEVPRDAGVMGFDNIDTLEFLLPSMATVDTPVCELGVLAVRTLLDLVEGKEAELRSLLDYSIIDGASL
jgi:LacI family transcriptional regulator